MYENLRLGYSPLTQNVYLGRINPKKPGIWSGEKKDVTNEFISVLLNKFKEGEVHTLTINGTPTFELSIKRIKEEKS